MSLRLRRSRRRRGAESDEVSQLGKIMLRRGDVARAAEQLENAFELDPEDMNAAYQLAQALQRMGQTERAKELFTKVSQAKSGELEDAQRNLMRIIKAGSQ